MINLSDSAKQELLDHFAGWPHPCIRIKVAPGACMGPRLVLAPDGQLKFDEAVDIDGLTFVMHKALLSQVREVSIDADQAGFKVSTQRTPDVDCSGGGDCESCTRLHGHSFPR